MCGSDSRGSETWNGPQRSLGPVPSSCTTDQQMWPSYKRKLAQGPLACLWLTLESCSSNSSHMPLRKPISIPKHVSISLCVLLLYFAKDVYGTYVSQPHASGKNGIEVEHGLTFENHCRSDRTTVGKKIAQRPSPLLFHQPGLSCDDDSDLMPVSGQLVLRTQGHSKPPLPSQFWSQSVIIMSTRWLWFLGRQKEVE